MTQRSFLCALFLGLAHLLTAQTIAYQYTFSTETFTPLSNPTVLPQTTWDTDARLAVGFPFKLGNKILDSLDFSPYEGSLFDYSNFDQGDTLQAIFAYNTEAGLASKPGSQVAYAVEGIAPNRIFKAEWLKVGFESEDGEVSFQIWVYETSNKIQIKLGPQNVPNPTSTFYNNTSPLTGLGLNMTTTLTGNLKISYGHWVKGSIQTPTDTILYNKLYNNNPPLQGCNAVPLEKSVFTFTTGNSTALHPAPTAAALQFFPNPATAVVYFTEPTTTAATVEMVDMLGRTVLSQSLSAGSQSLVLPTGLAQGTYLLRRTQDNTVAVGKLIVR